MFTLKMEQVQPKRFKLTTNIYGRVEARYFKSREAMADEVKHLANTYKNHGPKILDHLIAEELGD